MRAVALILSLVACSVVSLAQPASHHAGGARLFLARATGDQVIPRRSTAATATAALIVDIRHRQISYDLTYSGLRSASASRIALYNFDSGGNGARVALLCGAGTRACPAGRGARLGGTLAAERWRGPLLAELASGRVYIQIDSGGRAEIRGQFAANMAMVRSRTYLAKLVPSGEAGASGAGTAVMSETFLPNDRIAVEYHVTVSGTSGRPEAASLAAVSGPGLAAFRTARSELLPTKRVQLSARPRDGATFAGGYTATGSAQSQNLANFMMANNQRPVLTISTSRFPRGELIGEFVPVE